MSAVQLFITGATGFVGSHLVEELAARPVRIRALVRQGSDTRTLLENGVELRSASLAEPESLAAAMEGSDVVIHLAALTHARTEAELQQVNASGTASVARATAQVKTGARFVYLSSLAAAGPSGSAPVRASDTPHPLTAYGRSKLAGEVALRRQGGLDAVTLRAPAVYGPRDREMLRFFKLARRGVLPIPGGPVRPLQLVHVKDLARAVADAALASGSCAGTYHIADPQAYAWKDVCRLMGQAVGRSPVFLPVPGSAIAAAAAASELMARAVGRSTMFNRDKVRELLAPGWLCETDAAKEAFGFAARIPLPDGLRSTADWYRSKGWL